MKIKSTGMVRRVDDLGRVVIPKELRRSIGIGESDPLEILVDSETQEITLRKYKVLDYKMLWEDLKKNKDYKDKLVELEENYKRDFL